MNTMSRLAAPAAPFALRRCPLSAEIIGATHIHGLRVRVTGHPADRRQAVTGATVIFDTSMEPRDVAALADNIRHRLSPAPAARLGHEQYLVPEWAADGAATGAARARRDLRGIVLLALTAGLLFGVVLGLNLAMHGLPL
jgi:hypothetical protein